MQVSERGKSARAELIGGRMEQCVFRESSFVVRLKHRNEFPLVLLLFPRALSLSLFLYFPLSRSPLLLTLSIFHAV